MNLRRLLLYTLFLHAAVACARVDISLFALSRGASAWTVGVIMSLHAVIPMIVSVQVGRFIDRVGPYRPMFHGTLFTLAAIVLAAALPALSTLFFVAPILGLGFLFFHIAAHQAVGMGSTQGDHTRNFGLLAVAFSASSFIGPTLAGFAIDYAGHRATFAIAAALCAMSVVLMAQDRAAPQPPGKHAEQRPRRVMDLVRSPRLRPILIVSALLSMSWDLFNFAIPIYGVQIGLSASRIGVILGAFGLAIFVVRMAVPWIARHLTEWQTLLGSMLITGASFAALTIVTDPLLIMSISFVMGFGLGAGQPMIMTLIYQRAPEGRAGEAVGVRSLLINVSQTGMPLVTGAFGAALGMAPGFLIMAGMLVAGAWYARRWH